MLIDKAVQIYVVPPIVVHPAFLNVLPLDSDVFVCVCPNLLVVGTQSVQDLMHCCTNLHENMKCHV